MNALASLPATAAVSIINFVPSSPAPLPHRLPAPDAQQHGARNHDTEFDRLHGRYLFDPPRFFFAFVSLVSLISVTSFVCVEITTAR